LSGDSLSGSFQFEHIAARRQNSGADPHQIEQFAERLIALGLT
jgi:hypothetical protein